MDKGSIVLMEQPETKIYSGETGYIVIRQENWQDTEQIILIDPQHAKAICDAIMAQKASAEQGFAEWKDAPDGK